MMYKREESYLKTSLFSRDSFENEGEKHESGGDVKGMNLKKLEIIKKGWASAAPAGGFIRRCSGSLFLRTDDEITWS